MRRAGKIAAGWVLRSWLRLTARDETGTSAGRSCLVLAPHPDDETLGCALAILVRRERGTTVTVAVMSDGAANPPGHRSPAVAARRHAELVAAASVLCVDEAHVRWLGLPDQGLDRHHDELVAAIRSLAAEMAPQDVLVTSATDPHPDHAALGRAAREALAHGRARLLEYPIWQWDAPRRALALVRRRPVVVRAAGHRERKLQAIACYASQLGTPEEGGLPPSVRRPCSGRFELFFPVDAR